MKRIGLVAGSILCVAGCLSAPALTAAGVAFVCNDWIIVPMLTVAAVLAVRIARW